MREEDEDTEEDEFFECEEDVCNDKTRRRQMRRSYKFISTSTSFFSVKEFYWSYNVETLPEN